MVRERSEPAEGCGGAVAKRAAGARPPLLVVERAEGGGGAVAKRAAGARLARPPYLIVPHRRRRPRGIKGTALAERARRRRRGSGREASRGGKAPFVSSRARRRRRGSGREASRGGKAYGFGTILLKSSR